MPRVQFCGVIEGSVPIRDGETEAEALQRAESVINNVLLVNCKRLSRVREHLGPVVGLEVLE